MNGKTPMSTITVKNFQWSNLVKSKFESQPIRYFHLNIYLYIYNIYIYTYIYYIYLYIDSYIYYDIIDIERW